MFVIVLYISFNELQVDVIAVEYPGFGVYKGESSEEKINSDAMTVYEFVMFNLSNIYQQ